MQSVQKFNALNGAVVSRLEIERIIDLAKKENQTDIIYRLSKILNDNPTHNDFDLDFKKYKSTGLNAARHSGKYVEALDDCGRLRPGYQFKNGTVVKIAARKKPPIKRTLKTNLPAKRPVRKTKVVTSKDADLKSKILKLKSKYAIQNYNSFPSITKGLNGVLLADGHTVLSGDEKLIYLDQENTGLNAAAKDVEQIVNELILNLINNGEELPAWKQSWAAKTSVLAQNYETKKPYSGSNSTILNVLLGSIMPTPYYLTATQITNMGGMIKKGAKSVPLVYYNFIHNLRDLSNNPQLESELLSKINGYEIKRKGKATIVLNSRNYANVSITEKEIEYLGLVKQEYISKGFLRYYRVFNIADTTGIKYDVPEPKNNTTAERIELAEAIIKGFTDIPKITTGKDAVYNLTKDIIEIPEISQFDPIEEYYTTLFHEMIHSTLHKTRLNREEKYKDKEKEAQYAFEELIAELGASYLAGLAGILNVVHMNSASYLKNWHEKLQKLTESNSNFFVFATKEAQKAVDYILQGYVEPGKKEAPTNDKVKAEAMAAALKLKLKLRLRIDQN